MECKLLSVEWIVWKFFEAGQARGFRAIKKMTLLDRVSNKQLWKRLRVEGSS